MRVITIGRSNENEVVITDPYASLHHLQIIQHDDGHFTLSDFGSTNGTYVNGQKIGGEIPLNDMDIVRIGNTTIPWRMYFEEDCIIPQEEMQSQQGGYVQTLTPCPQESKKENTHSKERHEITMSTTPTAIALMVIMGMPLIFLMVMGAWFFVGRLVVALLFGILALLYSKKADKKVSENEIEKAVKAAKNARGCNILQIL